MPRKIGLNWFMPAFAKRSEGSACGTTEEDWTRRLVSTIVRHRRRCESLLTESMVMLLDKVREEGLADLLSRPFDLRYIGGTHPGRYEAVSLKLMVHSAWFGEVVEGSRKV